MGMAAAVFMAMVGLVRVAVLLGLLLVLGVKVAAVRLRLLLMARFP